MLALIDLTAHEFSDTGGAVALFAASRQSDAGFFSHIEDVLVVWYCDSAVEFER